MPEFKNPYRALAIMGALVLEATLPDRVKDELRGEPVLFSVREARLVSKGGAVGGAVFGALVAFGGMVALGARGEANATVDIFGFAATGDSPEGRAMLLTMGLVGLALGFAMVVAAPIVYRMPGMLVVGTPTRILHAGRWRVHSGIWREVASVKLGDDGSVEIKRYPTGARSERSLDIVQPPRAAELVAIIAGIIQPAPSAPAPHPAPSAATAPAEGAPPLRTFRTTRKGMGRGVFLGAPFLLIGLVIAVVASISLLSGGTVSASTNDGPVRELTARDAEAWVPVWGGLLFAAVGGGIVWIGLPRKFVTTYEIHDDALFSLDQWGLTESSEWRLFTGEVRRTEGRHGSELRFPLHARTQVTRRSTRQAVIEMIGVENADAVEAEIRRHFV